MREQARRPPVVAGMEPHNARDPERLTDTQLRAGVKIGTMRYVLLWGTVAAVILVLLALVYFYV